ncbi:hypothetical protein [Tumebacillus algifaecis]|uniref:hypothetical protein n=1 Tax=Tumebacillus algifaecis TaxID=1214604 RepID=UPI0012FE12BD|nr:hypothetical protein [Tumebacillus algifaecis]
MYLLLNYLPSSLSQVGNSWPFFAFLVLVAFSLLCFQLSVKLFERNSFERNGRFWA